MACPTIEKQESGGYRIIRGRICLDTTSEVEYHIVASQRFRICADSVLSKLPSSGLLSVRPGGCCPAFPLSDYVVECGVLL